MPRNIWPTGGVDRILTIKFWPASPPSPFRPHLLQHRNARHAASTRTFGTKALQPAKSRCLSLQATFEDMLRLWSWYLPLNQRSHRKRPFVMVNSGKIGDVFLSLGILVYPIWLGQIVIIIFIRNLNFPGICSGGIPNNNHHHVIQGDQPHRRYIFFPADLVVNQPSCRTKFTYNDDLLRLLEQPSRTRRWMVTFCSIGVVWSVFWCRKQKSGSNELLFW